MNPSNNQNTKYLGIVTPMANEESSALEFVRSVLLVSEHPAVERVTMFVILDKASKDNTRPILEDYARRENRLNVVYAPENRCVVDAYMKGYDCALAAGCDWILEIDAGFSHDPQSIPEFLAKMNDSRDVIYATRFTLGGGIRNSSMQRKCISKFGGMVSNLLLGTTLGDMTSGFILYSRHALSEILGKGIHSRGPFFQTEMKFHARRLRYAEVPIQYQCASHQVGRKAIGDACSNLFRLVRARFTGA